MTAMVLLGLWQLGVYDDRQSADSVATLDEDPQPLDDVLGPDEAFPSDGVGKPVTVRGTYVADEQLYVEGLSGNDARYAVVTPLLTNSGSAVLVVRGGAEEAAADVPPGAVDVTGVLEPPAPEGGPVATGRITDGLRIAALVEAFSEDLYGGYVIASGSSADGLSPITAPAPDSSGWAGIRNLLYAIQWWLFAAFVGFMWWRIVGDLETAETKADQVGYRP